GTRPAQVVAITAAGWLVIAFAATWGAGRGRSMLGRPTGWLLVVALATAPTFLLWFLMWTMMWPEASAPVPAFGIHLACFATTIVFSLSPIVAFVVARHGSDPVKPRATGAALGAAAGAWAGVMIDLHCPVSATAHVLVAHVAPIVFLAVAGAWLGRRVLGIGSPRT
ncbi:MAG: NrsF family protein, partial [Polyangiaceae bacterium]